MKKKLVVLAVTALALSLMAGCGKSDTTEYVTIPEYKGLEVEVEAINVTDEEKEAYIQEELKKVAVDTEVTDRAVQEGDIVNIDFEGKKDGVAFEGGTSGEGGYDLTIGSGKFIAGFEEGLIGSNIGDTVELDLTFPEDYGKEELNGQPVVFTVKINKITISVVPELTDEIVPTLTEECKTVDEYKKYVDDLLLEEATNKYHSTIANDVFTKVVEGSTFEELPQDLLDMYKKAERETYESYATMYQIELEDFITNSFGLTMEEFETEIENIAEKRTKAALVIKAISEKEGFTATDKEIEDLAKKGLESYGIDQNVEEYIEEMGKGELEIYVLSEKVSKKLEEYAVVKEK